MAMVLSRPRHVDRKNIVKASSVLKLPVAMLRKLPVVLMLPFLLVEAASKVAWKLPNLLALLFKVTALAPSFLVIAVMRLPRLLVVLFRAVLKLPVGLVWLQVALVRVTVVMLRMFPVALILLVKLPVLLLQAASKLPPSKMALLYYSWFGGDALRRLRHR